MNDTRVQEPDTNTFTSLQNMLTPASPQLGKKVVGMQAEVVLQELEARMYHSMPGVSSAMNLSLNFLAIRCNRELFAKMEALDTIGFSNNSIFEKVSFTISMVVFSCVFSFFLVSIFDILPIVAVFMSWLLSAVPACLFTNWVISRRHSILPEQQETFKQIRTAGWDAELLDAHRGMLVSGMPPIPELTQLVVALKTSNASKIVFRHLGEQDSLEMFRFSKELSEFSNHAMKVRDTSAPKPQLVLKGSTQELLSRVVSALETDGMVETEDGQPKTYTI